MPERTPPTIFSKTRRDALVARAEALRSEWFLADHMADEVLDRLDFVRHDPKRTLLLGTIPEPLASRFSQLGKEGFVNPDIDEEAPLPADVAGTGFDLTVSLNRLGTVNDLPGALIHMHRALAPGGLAIAMFIGAPSLPNLRRAMLAADGDRPAARMHPLVDVRAAAELVQRAGWHSPVVDSHTLRVSYASLDRLVADLRAHGLTSALKSKAPALTRDGAERARRAFLEGAGQDGKVIETFEILTLSGWRR